MFRSLIQVGICFTLSLLLANLLQGCNNGSAGADLEYAAHAVGKNASADTMPAAKKSADTLSYRQRVRALANGDRSGRWPVNDPEPLPGAILPYRRVVAFYGNFYCKGMGILGELGEEEVLQRLRRQADAWQQADSTIPVVPAIHYIAVTAQNSPCDGTYRARMPEKEICKSIAMAEKIKGLVFLDVQVGQSTLQQELPRLKPYLQLPQVHLGIDPEFSMKTGKRPGTVIGSYDAADVNYASGFLADLVKEYKLPPKILVVHRFTRPMLTNYRHIQLRPEVQIVINMDGFGSPDLKRSSYLHFVSREPVQFTGFKVFYKNDVQYGKRIMQPREILELQPRPVYIQYQ